MTHFMQIYVPHSVIGWLFVGLIAGWLAGKVSRGRGFGCVANILIGLVGAFLGGWVFTRLGIFGGGIVYSIAAATIGAVILVAVARLFAGEN